MKNRFILFQIILVSVFITSCKTPFETVRTSNDPVQILAAANQYYEEEDWLKAQGLYEVVIPFYRGKTEAEDLFYKYSYTYYNMNQYIMASHYFNNFTKTFYNSNLKEEMAFMSAYANYKMSPVSKLDQTPTKTAILEMQTFINTYPNSPRVDECNVLIDEMRLKLENKSFEEGKLYFQLGYFQAAMSSFEITLKDFPETKRAKEIRFYILKSSHELAKNSVYEKMKERLEDTIDKCEKFRKKYAKSEYNSEVAVIKKYCSNELKRFVQ